MSRDHRVWLDDIFYCLDRLNVLCQGLDYEEFLTDLMRQEAILRNLEIIGEAVRHLPQEFKDEHPDVEWTKISGLRNILIHEYFVVDLDIVWDVITNKIPLFHSKITTIQND